MTGTRADLPVIVGIDGSEAAVEAALWAVEEAVRDDTTLLLVSVVDTTHEDREPATKQAREALVDAWEKVLETGRAVKVDSEILYGDVAMRLAEMSARAEIICLGHRGSHGGAKHRGETASGVAHLASGTVVLVRHRRKPSPTHQWIITVLDDHPDAADVLHAALEEARLRQAPVLALTSWSTDVGHPGHSAPAAQRTLDHYLGRRSEDVRVCAIPMPTRLLDFLDQCVSIDQLVVVSARNAALTDELTSAQAAKVLHKSNVSLMFVRPQTRSRRLKS